MRDPGIGGDNEVELGDEAQGRYRQNPLSQFAPLSAS